MGPQRQRREDAATGQGCPGPPELGAAGGASPRTSGPARTVTLGSGLQNWERIEFGCSKHPPPTVLSSTAPGTCTEGTTGTRASDHKAILSRAPFPPELQAPTQWYTCSLSWESGRQGRWFWGAWQAAPQPPGDTSSALCLPKTELPEVGGRVELV